MSNRTIPAFACAALLLAACASPPTAEQAGMVVGGIAGGVAGSELGGHHAAGTIIGTLAGAALGGLIGRAMDENDRHQAARALEVMPSGRSSSWRNPDTGNSYVVTPLRTYDLRGEPCRDYTVDALVAGRRETVRGTACRHSDGSWRVQG